MLADLSHEVRPRAAPFGEAHISRKLVLAAAVERAAAMGLQANVAKRPTQSVSRRGEAALSNCR